MERIRILLIEDNPGDARLIKEMLSEDNSYIFDLEWKENLQEGLKRLEKGDIDVILQDLMLPDSLGGYYTFKKVHAQSRGIPIIVMTSFDDESFAISTVLIGARDYLIKGKVDKNKLVSTIRNALENKQKD